MIVDSSLERIYPDISGNEHEIGGTDTVQLHLERYHFAGKNLIPGHIADVACGAGYGSYLLATQYKNGIETITAIDNSRTAIEYAKEKYKDRLINFVNADAMTYQASTPFSTVISLETIEHLAEPEKFIRFFTSQLISGGRFIASAPVTPSMDANPYHFQDFTVSSFKNLFLKSGLTEVSSTTQKQSYNPFGLFKKKKQGRNKDIRQGLGKYYLKHPGKLLLRLQSLVKDGFTNKYLIVIFEKK